MSWWETGALAVQARPFGSAIGLAVVIPRRTTAIAHGAQEVSRALGCSDGRTTHALESTGESESKRRFRTDDQHEIRQRKPLAPDAVEQGVAGDGARISPRNSLVG